MGSNPTIPIMKTLKIMPFGEISQELLDAISEELRYTFNILCDILGPAGLPKEYYNQFRHQFVADRVLDFLSERFKGNILAVTDEDLYSERLSFIFGQAELPGRVAIVSIHRLDLKFYKQKGDKNLLKERTVKEAVHEVGHALFGLTHCPNHRCVMCFSNTIVDVDRKDKNLCDVCKARVGLS